MEMYAAMTNKTGGVCWVSADLRSQAMVLQVPSEHRYSPVSQGSMILMVRVTLAFRLEME